MESKRVCVVGAGAAGLCATKYLLQAGIIPKVIERGSQLGGTWVYTDQVGQDQFGLPVHTSLYKSLRTNFPTQIMSYSDFPIPDHGKSFLSPEQILAYLRSYADRFDIEQHIQFNHYVDRITPKGEHWEVKHVDLISKQETVEVFDVVMICNGHYSKPRWPRLEGIETFSGKAFHSHDYRVPDDLKDQKVLLIGAGFSGMDIALDVSTVAERVFVSHRHEEASKSQLPGNVYMRAEVARIDGDRVVFVDGTSERIDTICYCTGYDFDFHFLDVSCGVEVVNRRVRPLYKHMIHIERPTMCFIGLPLHVVAIPLMDLQVRYYLKYLTGAFQLPIKEDMHTSNDADFSARLKLGMPHEKAHLMGVELGRAYYDSLSKEAGLERLPNFCTDMHRNINEMFQNELQHFRRYHFKMVAVDEYVYTL